MALKLVEGISCLDPPLLHTSQTGVMKQLCAAPSRVTMAFRPQAPATPYPPSFSRTNSLRRLCGDECRALNLQGFRSRQSNEHCMSSAVALLCTAGLGYIADVYCHITDTPRAGCCHARFQWRRKVGYQHPVYKCAYDIRCSIAFHATSHCVYCRQGLRQCGQSQEGSCSVFEPAYGC